jgi:superfamily II DNA/RNA helicase
MFQMSFALHNLFARIAPHLAIEYSGAALTDTMSFDTLGLSDKVIAAVAAAGYTEPTPIQAQAIPVVLENRDVVGIAQTGTGKTASFVLPMMTKLEQGRARARMPRTLILEPTRELAAQVEENFNKYSINQRLTVALLIGGVSFEDQNKKLDRGVDVLIATPGRLLDHFERGRLLLTGVEILVIDEADRMLDMGFIPDIERICKMIPPGRQTLMFSATMPNEIERLANTFLRDPVRISVAKASSTATTVTQKLVASGREAHEKREVLRELIRDAEDMKNAIVFCNRKRDVQIVYKSLEKHGFSVGALHGDMDQRARTLMLDGFRGDKIKILVASDVAARGLDIPDVSHVLNFDVPIHAEDYVHRIGRTGRAGRSGTAVTIVTSADTKFLGAIEKLIAKSIDWMGSPVAASSGSEERHGFKRDGANGKSRRGGKPDHRRAEAGESPRVQATEGQTNSDSRRPSNEERPQRREAKPQRPPATAPVSRERPAPVERPQFGDRMPRRDRSDRYEDRNEPEVVGLGDHVPAFLLRPVRPARSAS